MTTTPDTMTTAPAPATATDAGVDPNRFRDLMARVCAPVTIVTTADADGPHGATASSFTSLSQEPPLITVAFDRRSALLQRIQCTGRFGINLLHHRQDDLAMLFATRGAGADRFAGTSWRHDTGLPRINGAAGWAECELYDTVQGGDHLLLMGLVTKVDKADLPPLVYAERIFGTHSHFVEPLPKPIGEQTACAPD
ncbi:flavin reductase family protein [Rhodococcus opacus]|nr:flavin reductase family protein [Rhodococcus opacus]